MRVSVWPLSTGGRQSTIAADSSRHPIPAYSVAVFQSLAVFRFFSYALGVGLVLGLSAGDQSRTLGIAIMVVGLYNTLRVAWRSNPSAYNASVQWLALTSDVAISGSLVLVTGGLDSPFLLYSLAPVLSASLLMHRGQAITVAIVSALCISGAHVAGGLDIGSFPALLDENYLVLSVMYLAIGLLIAYLPFVANLNWQGRIRFESRDLERHRLRREVHDNVAQTLAFLSLKMRHAEIRASTTDRVLTTRDIAEVGKTVQRAYVAVRDYLDGTSGPESDGALSATVTGAVDRWSRDTGLPADLSIEGEEPDLPAAAKVQLVQIAREALTNVAKHASATRARVTLVFTSTDLTLRVMDDGRGFPTLRTKGHGLDIMAERAAMVGASLSFSSAQGEGTEVIASYPFPGVGREPQHDQHPGASRR